MQFRSVNTALAVVLLAGGAGECRGQTWRKLSSPKGGFSMLLPGKPLEEKGVEPTPHGPLTTYSFTVERGAAVYTAGYSELPAAQGILPSGLLLSEFLDGMIEELGTVTILGERDIALKGAAGKSVRGRALTFRDEEGTTYTARAYRVRRRLYHLLAVTALGEERRAAGAVQKFLGSFALQGASLKPPAPVAWSPFSSVQGKFSVLLPGRPTQQVRAGAAGSGVLKFPVFTRLSETVLYTVTYQDFAEYAVAQGPEKALSDFQTGMINGISRAWAASRGGVNEASVRGAMRLSQSRISLQGWPGREVRFMDPGGMAHRARFYLARQRIYVLSTSVAPENQSASAAEVEKFLRSLVIKAPPGPLAPEPPVEGNVS